MPPGEHRPLTALPSVRARVLAFAAIVIAGVCGGLIGSSFVSLQCHGNCTTPTGVGAIGGAVIAAAGVAVVAVLTLRAMGEWRRISEEQLYGEDQPYEDNQPYEDDQPYNDESGPLTERGDGPVDSR